MEHPRKPLKQADPQPVATHGNRFGAHGKEHVCHRLPTIPFLLERESTSWLRKGIESREPEGPQDSFRTLTATACRCPALMGLASYNLPGAGLVERKQRGSSAAYLASAYSDHGWQPDSV
jgi:hypothetical protein